MEFERVLGSGSFQRDEFFKKALFRCTILSLFYAISDNLNPELAKTQFFEKTGNRKNLFLSGI